MKNARTKNASRNIFFGVCLKIYQIIFPFIMRSVMIYFMGVKYLGLNSLFTSILHILNLAELGVGSAMVYSMYKPIVENNNTKICALLNLYKKYYRIIGLIIAVIGMCILPIIPKLITGDIPGELNIYILYLLNLFSTVLSYWLFAYKNSILQAFQRNDIISKITIITNTMQYIFQIIAIIAFKNYYVFVIIMLLCQVITNIVTAIVTNKMYPKYKAIGNIDVVEKKEINNKIKDLFTSRIGSAIINSADTIVISAFLGLSILAIYQNYFYIISALIGMFSIIYKACIAGIGNSIIVESKEKNYKNFKTFSFIIMWITGFCSVCLLCLFQPFMNLWVGEKYMLNIGIVVCLAMYFYIYEINQLLCTYKDAAGIWHEDRFRPLITSVINLLLNLLMVKFWGLYGIIFSTVLSTLFIGTPWLIHNLFSTIFNKKDAFSYARKLLIYCFTTILSSVIAFGMFSLIKASDIWNLIIGAIICLIIPNIIYFVFFRKSEEYKNSISLVKKMLKL